MRELRGAIVDEADPVVAEGASNAVPIAVARAVLKAVFERLMQGAVRFQEMFLKARETGQLLTELIEGGQPVHAAIRITTGAGKSEVARTGIAWYVTKAKGITGTKAKGKKKTKKIPHRALVLVPTHRLGEEARQRVPAGTTTALWQSRKANDLVTGEPLCLNLPAVEAAELIGLDVERTACRKGRRGLEPILCSFYERCGYQAQKAAAKNADILFCAHQLAFSIPKELVKKVGVVTIDESFWQCGLVFARIAVDGLDAELESFPVRDNGREKNGDDTAHLADLIARLQRAIKASSPGEYLTKAALLAAGLLPSDKYDGGSGAVAAKLEWRRKVNVDLNPASTDEMRNARMKEFQFLGQLSRRTALWRAVDELLSGDADATGRLRTEVRTTKEGSVLWLKINGRREIHKRIAGLPIVVLDATLNIQILKYFLPRIEIALDIEVEAPHERVTQILGLPVGKSSLSQLDPGKRSPAEEKRVGNKRDRLIEVVRKLAAGRSCLLVTHKDLEAAFSGIGLNIETAHFNAIEGIDRWRNIDCLITIGRPLPAPDAVEEMAAALTGKPVLHPLAAPTRPGGRPQTMIEKDRGIRLKGGAEHPLACRVFELPEAELIRQAVTESAVVQAVGRARGVNRSESNPVEIWMILDDTVVPIAVDAVADFGSLEPGKIDIMIERGLIPAWSADAAKLYPDLWANAQSARKAYSRDGLDILRNRRRSVTSPYKEIGGTPAQRSVTSPYNYISIRECHTPLLRYQPKGLGQKPRLALIDPSDVAGARARIEAALGELISVEVITDVGQLALPDARRGFPLKWGNAGSNLAARLAADAEQTSSTSLQGVGRLYWRVMAMPAGMMASGP